MQWVFFAVATVLLWGTSDAIFKKASDNDDNALKLLAYNGAVLGVCSVAYGLIAALVTGFRFSFTEMLVYLPIAAVYIVSMFFYYKALPLIKLSIAAPVANSSSFLVTLMCVFILKQDITPIQWVAVVVIAVGLIMLSRGGDEDRDIEKERSGRMTSYALGLFCAIMYCVLDAVGIFMEDIILGEMVLEAEGGPLLLVKNILGEGMSEPQAIVSYGLIYFVVGIVAFVLVKRKQPGYKFSGDRRKLVGSLVETAGQFTYIYALAAGSGALAAPFIACYSMVSVILSRIFLKEKLKPYLYVVVGLMIAGMFILGM